MESPDHSGRNRGVDPRIETLNRSQFGQPQPVGTGFEPGGGSPLPRQAVAPVVAAPGS